MSAVKKVLMIYNGASLILRIIIGIVIGVVLALIVPQAEWISMLGNLFVGALKAIAPVLVAVLVAASLCQSGAKLDRRFGLVIFFYILSTYLAAVAAVTASFIFPQTITLTSEVAKTEIAAPGGLGDIVRGLLNSIIANPIEALSNGNYLGILFWAVIIGMALKRFASENTQELMRNLSDAVTQVVRWIINLAPFGILGLVFTAVSESGFDIFADGGFCDKSADSGAVAQAQSLSACVTLYKGKRTDRVLYAQLGGEYSG